MNVSIPESDSGIENYLSQKSQEQSKQVRASQEKSRGVRKSQEKSGKVRTS